LGTASKARTQFLEEQQGGALAAPVVIGCVGPFDDSTKLFVGQTDPTTSSVDKVQLAEEETEAMYRYYKQKLQFMNESMHRPDIVAIETTPSVDEALIALQALPDDLPCMLAFCPHPTIGR
jgi:S-methylmethionine-dependent homocysteine/selenocysteine methylase